jgi:hypothetical protein
MTGFNFKREQRNQAEYHNGWNDAIEEMAKAIEAMQAFPKDTLASFAIFIRNMKDKL